MRSEPLLRHRKRLANRLLRPRCAHLIEKYYLTSYGYGLPSRVGTGFNGRDTEARAQRVEGDDFF